jgi:hypothetical protein
MQVRNFPTATCKTNASCAAEAAACQVSEPANAIAEQFKGFGYQSGSVSAIVDVTTLPDGDSGDCSPVDFPGATPALFSFLPGNNLPVSVLLGEMVPCRIGLNSFFGTR